MSLVYRNFVILFFLPAVVFAQSNIFKDDQLKSVRFAKVYKQKSGDVFKLIKSHKLDIKSLQLFLRVFKKEDTLELWAKDKNNLKYELIKSYKICEKSGVLGPKRREGDGQVPEGFYSIAGFNPNGKYYLTLLVNYPNGSDKVLSDKSSPGGDICIHGKCVTIGCMPMTDPQIEEIYTLCVEAHANGQKEIPTYIFPSRLNKSGFDELVKEYSDDKMLISFWKNLKTGYDYFETNKTLPNVSVDGRGKYLFR